MPDHAAHPGHQFGTSAIFRFGRFVGGAFARRFFLAVANRWASRASRSARAFAAASARAICYADGIRWHAVHLAAADLADGRFQPRQRLFTLVQSLSQFACWARCSYNSVCCSLCFSSSQHAAWRLLHAFASTGQWFLARLVEIAEISL